MKKLLFLFLCVASMSCSVSQAQKDKAIKTVTKAIQDPEFNLDQSVMEKHMRFLASDELKGRRTTDMGNNIAARYIAEQFRVAGLKQVPGATGYYQMVPFENRIPPTASTLQWGKEIYEHKEDMIVLAGDPIDTEADVVFANFGWVDSLKNYNDYDGLDVKGKIVVTISGLPDTQEPGAVFGSMRTKRRIAEEKGAIAMVELYKLTFPWDFFKSYFGKARLDIVTEEDDSNSTIPYIWMYERNDDLGLALKGGSQEKLKIKTEAFITEELPSQNVIAMLEGTDPILKNEYILCTAHYDHVGVGRQGGGAFTAEDSIFNGARDNAMGTIAMLSAAKALSMKPVKRSIIFIAFTGEEMGLLGSGYYADNPLIPLNKTVYNLNTDGAGYDDVTAYSVLGYERVGTKLEFDQAAAAFDLKIIADPAPEQNLFDRSDNVNFAAKGIPAPTISPGTTGFSEEIQKYYHQVTDNPETIDFDYLAKYCKVYAHLARLVGNKDKAPRWIEGDKYEKVSKMLYGY